MLWLHSLTCQRWYFQDVNRYAWTSIRAPVWHGRVNTICDNRVLFRIVFARPILQVHLTRLMTLHEQGTSLWSTHRGYRTFWYGLLLKHQIVVTKTSVDGHNASHGQQEILVFRKGPSNRGLRGTVVDSLWSRIVFYRCQDDYYMHPHSIWVRSGLYLSGFERHTLRNVLHQTSCPVLVGTMYSNEPFVMGIGEVRG